jgi:hypothetical protein
VNPAEGVRRARAEDAATLRAITREAYAKWVAPMGREPAPMEDDFEARAANGQAWLLGEDALCILEKSPTAWCWRTSRCARRRRARASAAS